MKVGREIFLAALKLGLTSFGGPVAHLGYFRREYVVRRRWLSEERYADLVALCQALPGPASSQVGMAVGYLRGGAAGAAAAWLGFTLPSALLMTVFGALWTFHGKVGVSGLVRGLGLAALAVVTQAVWGMGKALLPGWRHAVLAGLALAVLAWSSAAWVPFVVLLAAGGAGLAFLPSPPAPAPSKSDPVPGSSLGALVCLGLFFCLLLVLPALRLLFDSPLLALTDSLYRTGALVFGGGHVVLPLLQNEAVAQGIGSQAFLAGYGAAQAVPGPLFSFSAYLGFLVAGIPGVLAGVSAIFLPSLLLVLGVLPFWEGLKGRPWFRRALAGVNASVVGLLAWAWYDPVLVGAVREPADALLGLVLTAGLLTGRVPSWGVVAAGALGGLVLEATF